MKTLTLKLTGYTIKGFSYVTLWDNTSGCISMKPFQVTENKLEEILKGINDNGFGCQCIDEADVEIYENYEGYLVFIDSITGLKIPRGYGKRGV